jgi:hypothetical protein
MASITETVCGPAPSEALYKDLDTLFAAIQAHARDNGYAFFTRNKKPRRVVYACDRAGKYDPKGKDPDVHPSKRRKNTGSKKCDCQMKVAATQQADGWMLKVIEATHNHGPFAAPTAHPAHRIAALHPDIRARIIADVAAGIRNQQILSSIQLAYGVRLVFS